MATHFVRAPLYPRAFSRSLFSPWMLFGTSDRRGARRMYRVPTQNVLYPLFFPVGSPRGVPEEVEKTATKRRYDDYSPSSLSVRLSPLNRLPIFPYRFFFSYRFFLADRVLLTKTRPFYTLRFLHHSSVTDFQNALGQLRQRENLE